MASILRILWFILICYATAKTLMACSCARESPSRIFCDADWVSHVHVIGSIPGPEKKFDYRFIQVKHVNPLKVSEPLTKEKLPTEVMTPFFESMCGVKLANGKEYILAGIVMNGTLRASLCEQFRDENSGFIEVPSIKATEIKENIALGAYKCA